MSSILRSRRFREEREAQWRRLDDLLQLLEKGRARELSDREILLVPVLYRSAVSSLSVARATSLDHSVVEYLEDLCTRGYFLIYGTRTNVWARLGRFFTHDWPASAQALSREVAFSAGILVMGIVVGYMLVTGDPEWFGAFVSTDLSAGRDAAATTEYLRRTLYDGSSEDGLTVFATYLFTHNSQVAILAFSLGFAFCLPTVLLLASTGLMAGAFFALYASHGLAYQLGGWLLVHGVTELSAIVLAGAAGLRIGWTMAFPGDRTRLRALSESGRQSATLMAGVLLMLLVAGFIEGVIRQRVIDDQVRYAIAATSGVFWFAYLFLPRGAPSSGQDRSGLKRATNV